MRNQMMLMMGAGVGTPKIQDVFASTPYTGNGSTQTITNGINLSGYGGMVWLKDRDQSYGHYLADTLRGADILLQTNTTGQEFSPASVGGFSSTGFAVGPGNTGVNESTRRISSWTFRNCPNFFAAITYSGNGASNRTISLPSGWTSAPGMYVVKDRGDASAASGGHWWLNHRAYYGAFSAIQLNLTNDSQNGTNYFDAPNNTATSTGVIVGSYLNQSGRNYVMYVFGHDTGTDGMIQCGTYTGSASDVTVTLGWEPQFILTKCSSGVAPWMVADTARGWVVGNNDMILFPHSTNVEINYTSVYGGNYADPLSTGFKISGSGGPSNESGKTYIYMAIRKGPM